MALSGNKSVKCIDDFKNVPRDVVAGAIHIYESALMNSDSSGNIKLSSDAASELFAGVSLDELNQASTASAGDNQVKLISKGSGKVIRMKLTGVTKANIGATVYASADDAVSLSSSNNVVVGTIVDIDTVANYCWVKI